MTNHTLIISPNFSPQKNGLAQYTMRFYFELKSRGEKKVSILTSSENHDENMCKDVHNNVADWGLKNYFEIINQIKKIGPSTILIQYVPFMYSKRGGINFCLPLIILYFRIFTNIKVHIMFHELFYPLEPFPKAIIMNLCHHISFYFSSIGSNKIFVATNNSRKMVKRKLLELRKVYHLPVSSNVDDSNVDVSKNSKQLQYLLFFGTLHASKNSSEILNITLDYIKNKAPHLKCYYVGASEEQITEIINKSHKDDYKDYLVTPGYLEDRELSLLYQKGCLGICYFTDGISTRRGTALSALQHGIPLLSSSHPVYTSDQFKNLPFIFLVDTHTPIESFNSKLEFAIQNFENVNSPEEIRSFFVNNFSWRKIVDYYLSV